MKHIATITIFLLLLATWTVGCTTSNNEQKALDFTGTFGITVSEGDDTSRSYTFVLTQDGENVTGKYAYLEYVSENRAETLYDVNGNVSMPGTAELQLTVLQAFPPEASPEQEMTLNVVLQRNGEILHVNEWNLAIPRVE